MKNFTLTVLGVAMLSITTTSCKRKFTCTCVYPGSTIGTTHTTMKAVRKSDAEDACAVQNTGARANGGACAL